MTLLYCWWRWDSASQPQNHSQTILGLALCESHFSLKGPLTCVNIWQRKVLMLHIQYTKSMTDCASGILWRHKTKLWWFAVACTELFMIPKGFFQETTQQSWASKIPESITSRLTTLDSFLSVSIPLWFNQNIAGKRLFHEFPQLLFLLLISPINHY